MPYPKENRLKENNLNNYKFASPTLNNQSTYLHRACWKGDIVSVKTLLAQGIEIDTPDERGFTPLHIAVARGKLEVSRYLIEKGANLEKLNMTGDSILNTAISWGYANIIKLLLESGLSPNYRGSPEKLYPLFSACLCKELDIAELLIKHGADVNITETYEGNNKWNPLAIAISSNSPELVKLLIQNGASPNNPKLDFEYKEHLTNLLKNCNKETHKAFREANTQIALKERGKEQSLEI
jgi:ankyrin repeat protein